MPVITLHEIGVPLNNFYVLQAVHSNNAWLCGGNYEYLATTNFTQITSTKEMCFTTATH